jgi:plasmid stabilization system protein ParE
MRVRYTPRASTDLQRIHAFIAERNPAAAARAIGIIRTRAASLGDFPEIGNRSDEPEVRLLLALPYPYRIYYRIGGDEIAILHVRHTARRAPAPGEL